MPKPTLTHRGVGYFDSPVQTDYQFKMAMQLASNSSPQPYTDLELREFISEMRAATSTEAWLLWSRSPTMALDRRVNLGWQSQVFHALLLLHAFYDSDPDLPPSVAEIDQGDPDSIVVAVEALCTDPWADQALLAVWADKRLQAFSEAVGGAYELRVAVPERNTPLLEGFKGMGYFCFAYDPDPYHFPDHKKLYEGFGDLHFAKLLKVRNRRTQGKRYLAPNAKHSF